MLIDLVSPHRVAPSRLPISWLSDDKIARELQAVQRRRAADAAYEAELIVALAHARPAALDPPAGAPGARRRSWTGGGVDGGVSEFFTAELSAVLNLGRGTADYRHARARTWLTKLPATFAALAAGELDERRATQLAEVLMHTSPDVAGQVEATLLSEARDLSVARLTARATQEMLRLDAAAAEQRRQAAAKAADVHLHPSATDGRATLAADLPGEEAVECYDVVDQLAGMLQAAGDDRPIGALRAHVLSLLVRRPADHGLPDVRADLTITADLAALTGAGHTPGEVNGLPITATHLRELLTRLGALGATAPDGGTLRYALTGPDGELLATTTPRSWPGWPAAAAPPTPSQLAGVRCWARRHRPTPTPPPTGSGRSWPSATAAAGPQLRATHRLDRPGPRHRPRLRWSHRLHQPVLPVPLPPPAQDLRPRLAVHPGRERHPARHHTLGRHPDDPTTRPATTTTRPATTTT